MNLNNCMLSFQNCLYYIIPVLPDCGRAIIMIIIKYCRGTIASCLTDTSQLSPLTLTVFRAPQGINTFPPFPVFCCPQGISKLHPCPFFNVIFQSLLLSSSHIQVSRDMTRPTKWMCAQRRLRSAWASAQSDQSLRCPHEESLGPNLPIKRTAKTLIRLGGCPGWSESSLGAYSFCWFCQVAAQVILLKNHYLLEAQYIRV